MTSISRGPEVAAGGHPGDFLKPEGGEPIAMSLAAMAWVVVVCGAATLALLSRRYREQRLAYREGRGADLRRFRGGGAGAGTRIETPLQEARSVGRSDLLSQLGAGAMGSVYRAVDRRDQRTVALKLVKAEFIETPEFTQRFIREMTISQSLDHPNIVRVFESGEQDGVCMAMELLEGGSLHSMVEGKRLPIYQEFRRLTLQLLDELVLRPPAA